MKRKEKMHRMITPNAQICCRFQYFYFYNQESVFLFFSFLFFNSKKQSELRGHIPFTKCISLILLSEKDSSNS